MYAIPPAPRLRFRIRLLRVLALSVLCGAVAFGVIWSEVQGQHRRYPHHPFSVGRVDAWALVLLTLFLLPPLFGWAGLCWRKRILVLPEGLRTQFHFLGRLVRHHLIARSSLDHLERRTEAMWGDTDQVWVSGRGIRTQTEPDFYRHTLAAHTRDGKRIVLMHFQAEEQHPRALREALAHLKCVHDLRVEEV